MTEVRVLAVASQGGHWEQMMLLRQMLEQHDVVFATTNPELPARAGIKDAAILPDCNRDQKIKSLKCVFAAAALIIKTRPHVVLSTGAAPGFFCLLFGRLLGARTLWVDSVANGEQLSMCGKLSVRLATRCLTQWEHLAKPNGPHFAGNLL
jgi:UDP-N-acetylglucosamine:LPS N-acetylglucosamine transferase